MFDWVQMVVLALIQGLSEFLPVSSSAHLLLPHLLFGWQDQGLLFDVAVHLGTLVAVAGYFWRDLLALLGDIFPSLRLSLGGVEGELWRLVLATLPAVVAGFFCGSLIEVYARALPIIATTTLAFGVLLGLASWRNAIIYPDVEDRKAHQVIHWRHALLIGCAQAFALIPGTSRSGATITAGLLLGYTPATSARFSFLMSVPIILGAMLFLLLDVIDQPVPSVPLVMMLTAAVVAGISAYATIAFFLGLLSRVGLMPFVIYRLVLGVVLVLVILL